MNERTAHAAMDEAAEWAAKQDAKMRKAFPHNPLNDLQREFAPGVIEHQREKLSRSERILTVGIYLVSAGIAIAAVVFIVRNAPDFVLTAAKICG